MLDVNGHVHKIPRYFKDFLWSKKEQAEFSVKAEAVALWYRDHKESFLRDLYGFSDAGARSIIGVKNSSAIGKYLNLYKKSKFYYDRKYRGSS